MTVPRVRANLRVPTVDGAALATDVYLPQDDASVPVVVTRTAYDRSAHLAEGLGWAGQGLGYVVQDVRGRYASDGCWTPYRNERGDGAELIDWLAAQPWCDGRIVVLGGSYSAYTAWTMAVQRPHQVRAVISLGPAMGLARVKFDRAGILRLAEHAAWWLERAESRTSRTGIAAAMFAAHPDLLHHLPVADLPTRMWARLEQWVDTIAAGPDHEAPEAIGDAELAALPAATLHLGGWYDLLLGETLHQWRTAGSALPNRPSRRLVVGPWDHDLAWAPSTMVGCRDHGPESRIPVGRWQVDWIRQVLNGGITDAGARVFVVGANRWWTGPQWPPPAATHIWYAHADGTLGTRSATTEGRSQFRYDPDDPYPSADPGADRASLAGRVDAARYTSGALTADLTLAGTPTVHLYASSSAPATDFVVRLNEVTDCGRIIAMAQGAVDTGRAGPPPYEVPLDPVAVRVPTGSRLQLEITSSDFPHLARHLNTDGDRYHATITRTADQTIHSGATMPTAAILPILEQPWTST